MGSGGSPAASSEFPLDCRGEAENKVSMKREIYLVYFLSIVQRRSFIFFICFAICKYLNEFLEQN
jgi:hypothetical protein